MDFRDRYQNGKSNVVEISSAGFGRRFSGELCSAAKLARMPRATA
jgi:hypothetical protein